MAQGSRLTADQIERVAESLRVNPSWRAAADAAGASDRSLRRYRERAETYEREVPDRNSDAHSDWPYYEAAQRWRRARATCERELIDAIRQAAAKDWRAAWALLKAGWPERYSERAQVIEADDVAIDVETWWNEAEERAEAALAEITQKRKLAGME